MIYLFFFFFVKLEILKQLYSDMHALSVLKVGYLVTFLKKSQIMIFQKEKKKKFHYYSMLQLNLVKWL